MINSTQSTICPMFIVGKIAWARQLYRRIQDPMDIFQQHPTILQGIEAKKIIKNFNKLAKVLLEFEVLYHRGWLRQVGMITLGIKIMFRFTSVWISIFYVLEFFLHKL